MANCNTEDKRRSASNMFLYVINPIADGIIGTTDRKQAAGIYSGILSTGSYVAKTQLSLTATPGRRYSFGWASAILTGINLETGEPYHIIGHSFGARAKGFDTVSGKFINYAIKIGKHILVID